MGYGFGHGFDSRRFHYGESLRQGVFRLFLFYNPEHIRTKLEAIREDIFTEHLIRDYEKKSVNKIPL